jgi:demethylmenaquinone methyltransferase/2-methoxy-6-polyprenyl-1,4-benzoquinol methylase
MTQPEDKRAKVQRVFSRIARRYDLMNSLMTFGMHRRWRALSLKEAGVQAGARALDLGCGSGDYMRLLLKMGAAHVIGVDFSPEMLELARRRLAKELEVGAVELICADVTQMPFLADESLDIVTAGFALRNFADLAHALSEACRVLKPGGKLIALDLSRPFPPAMGWAAEIYLGWIVPSLASAINGTPAEYRWLHDSLETFPRRTELAKVLQEIGFSQVRVIPYGMGVVAAHIAEKAR